MHAVLQDLRHTLRSLLRAPGFAVGAVVLLGLGIGANMTVFSIVDAILFRPPPWGDASRVVHVYQDSDDGEPSSTSFPAYRDMTGVEVFSAVSATTPANATWESNDGPVPVDIEFSTASTMEVMGLSPSRGRWFGPEHDQVGGGYAAVVSWPTWTTRFGSDPEVVGRTIRLNGQPVTVIGVGPRGLPSSFPPFVTDFWLSISSTPVTGEYQVANLERRADHWYDVRARLAPGVTSDQARSAMGALATRLAEEFPEFNRNRGITVFESRDIRTHPSVDAQLFQAGSLLTAVVAVILLLACANLANLLLVRGLGRSGEMAVRRALGAGGGRVGRLFLFESTLLALTGGGLGLLLTVWALRVIPSLPVQTVFPGLLSLSVDGRMIVYALALVLVTGLLFGALPALRAARQDVAGTLRDDRRTSSLGRGTVRTRNALVAIQVGASLILVLVTGMLVRGLAAIQGTETGVDAERIAWVRTDLEAAGEGSEARRILLGELQERLAALPGVDAVAATSRLPAQGGGSTTTEVEDYTPPTGTGAVELDFLVVSDPYFSTMGIDLIEGRTFSADDVPDAGTVVLLNATAARRFWGNEPAVGRRLRGQGSETWRTVIGVVSDAPVSTLAEDPQPLLYFSERQQGGIPAPFLVVRTTSDPSAILPAAREAIREVRAALPIDGQGTLADHFGESLAAPRFATTLLGVFSLLAAALAGAGIYAVVAFGVARRSGELGIRMALGAGRDRVIRMVVGEVVGVVAVGLVGGLVLAGLAGPTLAGFMYGVEGRDPLTFGGGVLFVLGIAALAAWLPARRAADTDPVEALRRS